MNERKKCWLRFALIYRMQGCGDASEILDGESPHEPRGCIAQAWSVAEILRATVGLGIKRVDDPLIKKSLAAVGQVITVKEPETPLSVRNLDRRHFKEILISAGLPDIRLYDLRHTCATLPLAVGEIQKS